MGSGSLERAELGTGSLCMHSNKYWRAVNYYLMCRKKVIEITKKSLPPDLQATRYSHTNIAFRPCKEIAEP
jgi:hypothetical protein